MDDSRKRVLIVDDSVFARKILSDLFSSSPRIEVVGAASNGGEALAMVEKLKPDVVTMDVEMPGIDGIETVKRLMAQSPTPVVMLSSLTERGAKTSMLALRAGAVDVMAKPHGSHSMGLAIHREELINKVLAAANVDRARLCPVLAPKCLPKAVQRTQASSAFPVVIIASSTGGPRALRMLIPGLTAAAGVAYVVVQHLPEGFSGPLAEDLNSTTSLNVRECTEGDVLRPGDLLFARGGYHCQFDKGGRVRLNQAPPLWGVRPSADVTMASAVPVFGSRLIGVVLTGMGRDGADGIRLIKQVGGSTLAEHESSCVVYGMPRVAIESGMVDTVAPLEKMADAINATVMSCAKPNRRRHAA